MKLKNSHNGWEKLAHRRRLLLLAVVLMTTFMASSHLAHVLSFQGAAFLEAAVVALFACLFAWISFAFWTALSGLLVLMRGYDRYSITLSPGMPKLNRRVRTAVLMPIYNEDVRRVAAGVEVIYQSLSETGNLEAFDFYILSDTSDPDTWVAEEAAWAQLCTKLNAFRRLFYRHRQPNPKRKSGNIAEFCRRWGHRYEYMIVLDADSIMTGKALVRLVEAMNRHPGVGILQSLPMAVNRETLLGRLQQFANHLYGPLLTAGLHFLQCGDAQYWGHNAIIRIQPFMQHCGLPKLSGEPPLGGEIWSHDFVESALMRRAGWQVWLTYDLDGSYEEVPPTLLDELQRDRRWCQGNLQHLRLLFARGFYPAHRALFLKGALSYGTALLWISYLCISTTLALWQRFRTPDYFPVPHGLHPQWPVWQWEWALTLMATTLVVLFLPKVLALIWVWAGSKQAHWFGGPAKLSLSVLVESVLSTLLAPVRMIFHAQFVVAILMGRKGQWRGQARTDRGISWSQALRTHAPGMILGFGVGLVVALINRPFFWWLSPILISLAISPALCVLTSRASLGRRFRKLGLLLIAEEVRPPRELQHLNRILASGAQAAQMAQSEPGLAAQPGFIRAVVDPIVNDLHIALLRGNRSVHPRIARRRQRLRQKALEQGPSSLSAVEKRQILSDPAGLIALHREVWELAEPAAAQAWGVP